MTLLTLIRLYYSFSFYKRCSLIIIGMHSIPNLGKNSFTEEINLKIIAFEFSFDPFSSKNVLILGAAQFKNES